MISAMRLRKSGVWRDLPLQFAVEDLLHELFG
jgi:hypothetical protein